MVRVNLQNQQTNRTKWRGELFSADGDWTLEHLERRTTSEGSLQFPNIAVPFDFQSKFADFFR